MVDRRSVLGMVVTATTLAVAGCTDAPGGETSATDDETELTGTVQVAGSSTVYPLTLQIGQQFGRGRPSASVSVTPTGTGGGFRDFFCQGKTDLNNASRPISSSERVSCAKNGVEFLSFRVATDALTVVVNDDAEWVDCVTPAELATIWQAGGAETWADVRPDWPNEPIEHFGPTPDSGTYDYFAGEILGETDQHRDDYDGTEQDSTIVTEVSSSPYAIGYLGFAYYTQNDAAVRALAVDDGDGCVRPSLRTAKSGKYSPLSRPLFIYVSRASLERPVVREFVRYYLGRVDTEAVSDVGYVPLDTQTAEKQRSRLEEILS